VLLAAELAGSVMSRAVERVGPVLRFRGAVLWYAAVRAALVPLIAVSAPLWVLVVVCAAAGGGWRILAAQYSAASADTGPDDRSRNISIVAAATSAGALTGTAVAGWAYTAPAGLWAGAALLVVTALAVPVRVAATVLTPDHPSGPHPSGPHPSGPHPSGPHPSGPGRRRPTLTVVPRLLVVTSFFVTVAISTMPRLGAAVIALTAGPGWVGPAALAASVAGFGVPFVVGRADRWPLWKLAALSVAAPAVWFVAPYGLCVMAAWGVSSLIGGIADGQLDARAATGDDPAASIARLQTAQGVVTAGAAVVAAPLLAATSVAALTLAVTGFAAAGVAVVAAMTRCAASRWFRRTR
jgi:hypothetical protein